MLPTCAPTETEATFGARIVSVPVPDFASVAKAAFVPVTVNVVVPAGAAAGMVIVRVVVLVAFDPSASAKLTELGEKLPLAPAGSPVTVMFTVRLLVPDSVTVTVYVADPAVPPVSTPT